MAHTEPQPPAGVEQQTGIRCPNCDVRTEGLKLRQERKATKRHGVGFWTATVFSIGTWALLRAIFGRKQIIRYYRCPACGYQWSP